MTNEQERHYKIRFYNGRYQAYDVDRPVPGSYPELVVENRLQILRRIYQFLRGNNLTYINPEDVKSFIGYGITQQDWDELFSVRMGSIQGLYASQKYGVVMECLFSS